MSASDRQADEFLNSIRIVSTNNKDSKVEIVESDTIIIKGLHHDTPVEVINDTLTRRNAAFDTVKLMKTKSGISKGFAFVKFFTLNLARYWYTKNKQEIDIDGVLCQYEYCKSLDIDDWECSGCKGMNFSSRIECYRCRVPKDAIPFIEVVALNDGHRDIGTISGSMILIRGLSNVGSLSSIHSSFSKLKLVFTNIMLVRNRITKASLGFGFVEFDLNTNTNTQILQDLVSKYIVIDGIKVELSFAHMGSFIPVVEGSNYICTSRTESGKTFFYKYWDEAAYCETTKLFDQSHMNTGLQDLKPIEQFYDVGRANVKTTVAKSVEMPNEITEQLQKWSYNQKNLEVPSIIYHTIYEKLPSKVDVGRQFADLEIMSCTLCMRRFQSLEHIQSHQLMSKLHNQLTLHHRKRLFNDAMETEVAKMESKYTKSEPEILRTFVPTRFGIRGDNVGNQLMQKMGWMQGSGLGPDGNGIVKALKPHRRSKNLGLGSLSKKKYVNKK